jgi:hypothetical protein
LLGNIPIVGGLFKNNDTNNTSNELVIVVTPHILRGGTTPSSEEGVQTPTPQPLPTLPPGTTLPTPQPSGLRVSDGHAVLNTPPAADTSQPQPTPSAFAASNVFEYGHAPQNNYAQPQDAPQIFYVQLAPTVLTASTTVSVSVITTTNIARVQIGTATSAMPLSQLEPGKWQASFPASLLRLGPAQPTQQLTLSAYRADGFSTAIQIPISSR